MIVVILILSLLNLSLVVADPLSINDTVSVSLEPLVEPVDELLTHKKVKKGYINFSFDRKSLVSIINELAVKKGINIILPQNAADLELIKNQMITFKPQGKTDIPVDEAWRLLNTFLELSGFGLSSKKKDLLAVERVGKMTEGGINRSILPIYAAVQPDELPDSQERIRYIYYLRNLKVPTFQDLATNPIARILQEMLTPDAPVVYEPKTNAIIMTDKSNTIASVMRVIKELDHSSYSEMVDVIHLNNTPVQDIVKIFDSLRSAAGGTGAPFIRSDARTDSLSFFAEDTKIVADTRKNNLIIMGRQSAVQRISDFVRDSMDAPPESGKSVLHYYNLQYLDATQFAQVLSSVVAPLPATGEQATVEGQGGPERYFKGVVVAAEEIKKVDITSTTEEITLEARGDALPTGLGDQQRFTGGNRLVIAALEDDWLRLKNLIEQVDKPQPYVILEVLILDIRGTRQRLIAGTVRTKTDAQVPTSGFQFLSSNITAPNSVLTDRPDQLNQDLLRLIAGPNNSSSTPPLTSLLAPGSLIISANDPKTPGIFGILQVLDTELDSKVLSHPYIVTTNGQKATLAAQQLRRRRGDAVPGAAGVITVEIIDLPSTLQVQMIPLISSLNRLNLQVAVDINDFIDISSDTRTTRRVNTSANLESGQVLVIGGLTRTDDVETVLGSPFLSRIPIIGSLFSRRVRVVTKTNISVFICPTIVNPRLRGGLNVYTADKIRKARSDMDDSFFFGNRQDPITRLFFRTNESNDAQIRDYLSGTKNQPDEELIKTAKEKRREQKRPTGRPKLVPPIKPKVGPVLPLVA